MTSLWSLNDDCDVDDDVTDAVSSFFGCSLCLGLPGRFALLICSLFVLVFGVCFFNLSCFFFGFCFVDFDGFQQLFDFCDFLVSLKKYFFQFIYCIKIKLKVTQSENDKFNL